jgi:anti-anti-sigma factor
MFSCTINYHQETPVLVLTGRIDGTSSPEIEHALDDLAVAGRRRIVCDFASVTHVSSAGLRVFLSSQQRLSKAGGEIILCALTDAIRKVFELSGFTRLFRVIDDLEKIDSDTSSTLQPTAPHVAESERLGAAIRHLTIPNAAKGKLRAIGGKSKLATSTYGKDDVQSVDPAGLRYGIGLATTGESYDEYRSYFGEAVVLNNSIWYYPAAAQSAVDYVEYNAGLRNADYRFLHGCAFSGSFTDVLSITCGESHLTIDELAGIVDEFVPGGPLGIVILAESKGLMAMRLKKVPVADNRPADGAEVFAPQHFASWFDYPLDPEDHDCIVAGAGIYRVPSEPGGIHMHACVFERAMINSAPDLFERELARVLHKLRPRNVQHILGSSRVGRAVLGIIRLED